MNAKELKIEAPEGYEVDWDNSSNNIIRFKPSKKKTTYKDICRELFLDKPSWRLLETGVTKYTNVSDSAISCSRLTATSNKQLEQLVAINKLMNVAKYLNGDWEPDFKSKYERNWCIDYDYDDLILSTDFSGYYRQSSVYFKSEELALQAIEILGEEEVKKALGIFE
jgi:hypothetical protein